MGVEMLYLRLLPGVLLGLTLFWFAGCQNTSDSEAIETGGSRIVHLDITSRGPAFGGQIFGEVGPYEILTGTASAVADPDASENSGIVDLIRAPRNDSGLVEYKFNFHILKPLDLMKGNGVSVYEINNRGRRIVYQYFNGGGTGYKESDIGSGFLMRQGYTYISSGWMHSADAGGETSLLLANLPAVSEDGETITGISMEEWIDPDSASFGELTYPAVTLDQAGGTLTYRQRQDDPRESLPVSHWSYETRTSVDVTPPEGSDAGTIYEFIYEAQDPVVMGLGFAAIRDFVSFGRYEAVDEFGQTNPLFVDGAPVLKHTVAIGSSQSGRMVRDFLYQGFNRDTAGRFVFDGMNAYVAGARRTFVNARFAQPGRWSRQHEDHNYPMDEFPFTFETTTDPLSGKTDGILAVCTASETCPKIIQVDTESEWYGAHGSLVVTDTAGHMVNLPSNVRYWMLTTAHLQRDAGCRDPANPVAPFPYYRAAFDATVQWVRDDVEPPATSAPSVDDGTAVGPKEQEEGYPTIPGKPFNSTISTLGVRDFSSWPPIESVEKYPLFVPRLDKDGNSTAGVVIPEGVVPLATMGKAIRGPGFSAGELCSANGSWLPFPRTKNDRLAKGDSRLSIQERYPNGLKEYAEKYGRAVEMLVSNRYLLPEDGSTFKTSAMSGLGAGLLESGLR